MLSVNRWQKKSAAANELMRSLPTHFPTGSAVVLEGYKSQHGTVVNHGFSEEGFEPLQPLVSRPIVAPFPDTARQYLSSIHPNRSFAALPTALCRREPAAN